MENLFLEFAIRSALVALSTAALLRILRIRSAATQHTVWVGVLIVMLALPLWITQGPHATLPILPARTQPRVLTTAGSSASLVGMPPAAAHPANPETRPTAPSVRIRTSVLIGVYLIGVCVFLLRLAIGTIRANRLTAASCAAPVTVGWFRPRVVLPQYWKEAAPAQVAAILAHEQAHARRRDPLFQWLALFNRALFWFHPLAWWLERRLSRLAEEACDAVVLESGHDPRDYAQYLLDVARAVQRAGARVNVVAMAMPGTSLPGRIRKIIANVPASPISPLRMAGLALACTICSALFAAGVPGHAASPTRKAAPVVLAQAAAARQPAPPLEFEIATIKQNKSGEVGLGGDQGRGGSLIPGGQFAMRNVPLIMLLGYAFNPLDQKFTKDMIAGVPNWVVEDRFDIIGKAPAGLPARACFFSNYCLPDVRLSQMLRSFLVARFGIEQHREQRPTSVYELVVAKKGPKFRKSAASGDRDCRRIAAGMDDPDAKDLLANQAGFICKNMAMSDLANLLPEMAPAYIDRIVVDATGLTGTFDFRMVWVGAALIDQGGLTIFDAVDKQLGLKLEARKHSMPVTVIDHIEKLADTN